MRDIQPFRSQIFNIHNYDDKNLQLLILYKSEKSVPVTCLFIYNTALSYAAT